MEVKKRTHEQELLHQLALVDGTCPRNLAKEFKEATAFCTKVRNSHFSSRRKKIGDTPKVVIDVAGGMGMLGALFLIFEKSVEKAIVIDPAQCEGGRNRIMKAWGDRLATGEPSTSALTYRHECLRTCLPATIESLIKGGYKHTDILVVACHACQHLTEETCSIAVNYKVHIAVMPCCQKLHEPHWKQMLAQLNDGKNNISVGLLSDMILAGRLMGLGADSHYDVKIALIDEAITPMNRIVIGILKTSDDTSAKDRAHEKLARAYKNAHRTAG